MLKLYISVFLSVFIYTSVVFAADDCLNYYSGLKYYVNDFEVVKQNLGFVVETLTNYVRNNKIYEKGKEDINYDEIAKELDEDYKIKRIYSIPKTQDQYQRDLLRSPAPLLQDSRRKAHEHDRGDSR